MAWEEVGAISRKIMVTPGEGGGMGESFWDRIKEYYEAHPEMAVLTGVLVLALLVAIAK